MFIFILTTRASLLLKTQAVEVQSLGIIQSSGSKDKDINLKMTSEKVLILMDVLYVPDFSKNLVSGSQLV